MNLLRDEFGRRFVDRNECSEYYMVPIIGGYTIDLYVDDGSCGIFECYSDDESETPSESDFESNESDD